MNGHGKCSYDLVGNDDDDDDNDYDRNADDDNDNDCNKDDGLVSGLFLNRVNNAYHYDSGGRFFWWVIMLKIMVKAFQLLQKWKYNEKEILFSFSFFFFFFVVDETTNGRYSTPFCRQVPEQIDESRYSWGIQQAF